MSLIKIIKKNVPQCLYPNNALKVVKVLTKPLLVSLLLSGGLGTVWAAPDATLNTGLSQDAFIGEEGCFSATFTNNSTEAGFGPYVLMTLPTEIDVASISADIFKGKATLNVKDLGEIDSASVPVKTATDDYSETEFIAPDGMRLVRIEFPVGSLTQDSPPLDLKICATLPATVAPNELQKIQLTPGYRYGNSATGIKATLDTPTAANDGINPVLAIVKKDNNTPESERTPGPSFPFEYTLAVDIANGQTLTEINLSDSLPTNIQWTGTSAADISVSNPNCTVATVPNIDSVAGDIVNTGDNPGGDLVLTCASVTGVANSSHNASEVKSINGGEDIIVKFKGYITEILDESTCDVQKIDNRVTLNAKYNNTPLSAQTANDNSEITVLPAAVQKGVTGTPLPGETLNYTLDFQITDYVKSAGRNDSASVFTIVDVMPDGLTFEASTVELNIDNVTVPITPSTSNNQGETTVTYDIAAAAAAIGVALDASSVGRITYQAGIDQTYEGKGGYSGESVNSNDPITNEATLRYQLADNTTAACTNETKASVRVQRIKPSKVILNDSNASMAQSPYSAGEIVHYQIQMTIESGDAEAVVMKDTLPLPVHLVDDLPSAIRLGNSAADTDSNQLVYHSSLANGVAGVAIEKFPPVVSTSTTGNSISFDFGDVVVNPTRPITLTVNIPAKVSDKPFADDLILANLLEIASENTIGDAITDTGIVNVETVAPNLTLSKGILRTNGAGIINPPPTELPVDGNLSGASAGDEVVYQITVENLGASSAYDVVIEDNTPANLSGCSIAAVKQGNGTVIDPVNYTAQASPALKVIFNNDVLGAGLGVLSANDGSLGAPFDTDTVLVEVACTLNSVVSPSEAIENTAAVVWKSIPNGTTAFTAKDGSATTTIAPPELAKHVVDISANPAGAGQATGGDVVTYDIVVTLPEGVTKGLTLTDTLPEGFEFLSAQPVTTASGSDYLTEDFAGLISITSTGATTAFDDITLIPDSDPDNNTFVLRITARVNGEHASNQANTGLLTKTNSIRLTYTGQPSDEKIVETADVKLVTPKLTVEKSVTPGSNVQAGDKLTYTIVVKNDGKAPAFDVEIKDILDSTFLDASSLNITESPVGFTNNTSGGTILFNQNSGQSIAAGGSVTLKFEVTTVSTTMSGSSFTNTATAKGDSQDGVVTGESKTAGEDKATVNTSKPAVEKTIIDTSERWTNDNYNSNNMPVAIGEIVTYQLTYTIPEGVTRARSNRVVFRDRLPLGFEFISARYYSQSDTPMTYKDASGAAIDFHNDKNNPMTITPEITDFRGEPRNVNFKFGDITNSDDDADDEIIVFEVKALVKNQITNSRNKPKDNRAIIFYRSASGKGLAVGKNKRVRIAEPNLKVEKTASPKTAAGGQQIDFEVTVSNSTKPNVKRVTRAWETSVTDELPADYQNPSLTAVVLNSPNASRNGTNLTACASFTGNTLALDIDDASCSALGAGKDYLGANETITITYSATLSPTIRFGKVVTKTAKAQASSLPNDKGNGGSALGQPGSETGERTGSGGVNSLSVQDDATVTANIPTIEKTVQETELSIGAISTVTLTITLPQGRSEEFIITDTLPAGLRYTGGAMLIGLDSGVGATKLVSNVQPAGTNPLVFDFGTVTNSANTEKTIVIKYPVQVENVIANQRNTSLTNTAKLSYVGVDSANPPTDTATVKVIEADIEVEKTIVGNPTDIVAGDIVTYQLKVSNTDEFATAYRANIVDVLPPELLGGSPTVTNIAVTNPDGVVVAATGVNVVAGDAVITTTTNNDDTLSFPLLNLPPESGLTVRYEAKVVDNAAVGEQLTNRFSVDYNSLPDGLPNSGDGRNSSNSKDDDNSDLNNYGETASATLTLNKKIALQKQLTDAPASNKFVVGKQIEYDLKISLLEGTTKNVKISDTLPAGLRFVGVEPSLVVANVNSPTVDFTGGSPTGEVTAVVNADKTAFTVDLGDVTITPDSYDDNDYVIVRFTALVENVPANIDGKTLTNEANVTSSAGDAVDTQAIVIAEPKLAVEKSVSTNTPALGEEIVYTVKVRHDTGSSADAYNILLTDVIPAGLTYIAGQTVTGVVVDESNLSQPVFDVGSLPTVAGQKVFSYRAIVNETAVVDADLKNTISGTYASIDRATGAEDSGRNGKDGATGLNDYVMSDTATVTPTTNNVIDAIKTVALNDANSNGVADSGEVLTYTVTLKNTATTPVTEVVFTDAIPANTRLVANSVSSSVGNVTEGNPITVDGIASLAGGDSITIIFQVEIDADTPAGTVISNQGSVDSNETVPEPTDADGVDANGDQPTDIAVGGNPTLENPLVAEKTVELWTDTDNNGVVSPTDILRYTIVLNNTGSTGLTNVSFTDDIPAGLTATGTPVASASNADVVINGQRIEWAKNTPMTIPAGGFVNLVFDVKVNSFTGADKTFDNQGSVNYTDDGTSKTTQTDGNSNSSDGNQPTTITATTGTGEPKLDVQKRVALATDADNNGVANPDDTLTYTITIVNNGSAATQDARFSDAIPAQTTLVTGSVITDYGVVTSGDSDPIEVNLGSLQPGEVATVRFTVKIKAGTGGETASNQATVRAQNITNPVLSDDNGNSADNGGKPHPTLMPIYDSANTPSTAVDKTVLTTSETDSADKTVLIGEVVTYEVAITVPSGQLAEVSIIDELPSGVAYISKTGKLKRVFSTGLTASANPNNINNQSSDEYLDLVDDVTLIQTGQALSVFLGDVINSDGSDARYVLQYQVVVKNIADNQDAVELTNSATLHYLDGLNQVKKLAPINQTLKVIEPTITLKKTATPDVILSSGGTVTYTVEVSNNGAATAYELSIDDVMPSGWDLTAVTIPVGDSTITDSSDVSAEQVRLQISRLNSGETKQFSYTVDSPVTLADGDTADNTATARWSSLPNDNGSGAATPGASGSETGERTGSTVDANDYTISKTATVSVGTPVLEKTVQNSQTRYAIGDIVDYQVTLSLPAGLLMRDAVITDVLAEGLHYVSGSLVMELDGLTVNASPNDFVVTDDAPMAGQETLTLDVGRIQNTQSDSRTLTLNYQARVENHLLNQDGHGLTNVVAVDYINPGTGQPATALTDGKTVTVGEPRLALTKLLTSPTVDLQAGDTVSYQVSVVNNGTVTAHNVVLSDTLPAGLRSIAAMSVDETETTVTPQPVITVASGGLSWQSEVMTLAVGEKVVLNFTATLADSVSPEETIQNQAEVIFSSQADISRPDNRGGNLADAIEQDDDSVLNNYDGTAKSPSFIVGDPVHLDKQFYPNAAKTTYTIGEQVGYRVKLSVLEGTLDNVVITDTLPDGLQFVSAQIGLGNTDMITSQAGQVVQTGQVLAFDFGTVTNPANDNRKDDFVSVDIVARVANTTDNQDGKVLGNHVSVDYVDGAGLAQTKTYDADATAAGVQPLDLTVVEPNVTLSKTASVTEVSLGDVATFELTLDHSAASRADAYGVIVEDVLPAGMTYVTGSATPAPSEVSGQTLRFEWAALTLSDDNVTVRYQARMNIDTAAGDIQVNRANLRYRSLSDATGAVDSGRDGSDGKDGALNDYADNAIIEVTPTTNAAIDAQKVVVLSGDVDGDGVVDVGDVLTYTVTLSNTGEDEVTNVVFSDLVPANTTYVAGSLVVDSASAVAEENNPLIVRQARLASGARIVMAFEVTVNEGTPPDTVISNQGSVDSDQTVTEPTDVDGVDSNGDQPTDIVVGAVSQSDLNVEKTYRLVDDVVLPAGVINEGDKVAYDIVLHNTGQTNLINVAFSDAVPTGSSPAGMTVTAITSSKGTAPAATNQIRINDIGTLRPNERVTVTIIGTVKGIGEVSNQATVISDELGETLSDGDGLRDNGMQPTRFPVMPVGRAGVPQLVVNKTLALIGDVNSDNQINPGEQVRFTMIVRNAGSAVAKNVRLRDDTAKLNAQVVSGSVNSSRGQIISESPEVLVNIGDLAVGETVTVTFLANAERVGQLENTVRVSEANGQTATDSVSAPVVGFTTFMPPIGTKTVNAEDLPTLTWRMGWINPNTEYLLPVRLVDDIPENSEYVDGSLSCEVRGVSIQNSCVFDASAQQVIFTGKMGADAQSSDEDSAQHEVVITFAVKILNQRQPVINQASAQWDSDGNGDVSDNPATALTDNPETDEPTDPTIWKPKPLEQIPSVSSIVLVVLVALLAWLAALTLRRQRVMRCALGNLDG